MHGEYPFIACAVSSLNRVEHAAKIELDMVTLNNIKAVYIVTNSKPTLPQISEGGRKEPEPLRSVSLDCFLKGACLPTLPDKPH